MTDSPQSPDVIEKTRLSGASFSLKNRLLRILWSIFELFFFRFTPRQLHAWRVLILKGFGAHLGKHCHIYPKAKIWAPWNLKMDDHSCLANDVICYNQALISLGERAIVSQGAHLCTGSHDYNDPDFKLFALPIHIEKDAWVCAEAFVGPGVTIAEGAVLGARAVSFKDLPPWSVSSGNPAKIIKQRKIITSS